MLGRSTFCQVFIWFWATDFSNETRIFTVKTNACSVRSDPEFFPIFASIAQSTMFLHKRSEAMFFTETLQNAFVILLNVTSFCFSRLETQLSEELVVVSIYLLDEHFDGFPAYYIANFWLTNYLHQDISEIKFNFWFFHKAKAFLEVFSSSILGTAEFLD